MLLIVGTDKSGRVGVADTDDCVIEWVTKDYLAQAIQSGVVIYTKQAAIATQMNEYYNMQSAWRSLGKATLKYRRWLNGVDIATAVADIHEKFNPMLHCTMRNYDYNSIKVFDYSQTSGMVAVAVKEDRDLTSNWLVFAMTDVNPGVSNNYFMCNRIELDNWNFRKNPALGGRYIQSLLARRSIEANLQDVPHLVGYSNDGQIRLLSLRTFEVFDIMGSRGTTL